jgi:hypothetical protein
MPVFIRYLVLGGIALTFLFNGPLLDLVGWNYVAAQGSVVTKIHPALYIFAVAAALGLISNDGRYRGILIRPWFTIYLVTAVILSARAVLNKDGVQGQMAAAIVTFLMPAIMVIAVQGISRFQWESMGTVLRIFFVLNSLMGLAERLVGSRFIPSFIEGMRIDPRAAALLGHPLNASLLTGLLLVYLASARPRTGERVWLRFPEMLLHVCAMFAFGGRSALVFTTATILASAIWVRSSRGERRMSALQRALPFAILAIGVVLVFLPIPFIEATLARFQGDVSSTETRNAAFTMLQGVTGHDLLYGLTNERRQILLDFYNAPAIEISWIALMLTYGLIPAVLIIIGLLILLAGSARSLDRSATWMALLVCVVSVGSLAIGSKTLLITQTLLMMYALSQKRVVDSGPSIFETLARAQGRPRRPVRGLAGDT